MEWLNSLGTNALIVALILLVLRRQDKRMDDQDSKIRDSAKKVDGQPSREYCDLQHTTVKERFHAGDEKFEKLEGKIDSLGTLVTNIDTNVALILDRQARAASED
jgi:hypothetical protein